MGKDKNTTGYLLNDKVIYLSGSLAVLLLVILVASITFTTTSNENIPDTDPAASPGSVPVERLASATIELTKPGAASLVPYTERKFDASTTATVAWWMEPGFYPNTSEYRTYLRSSTADQKNLTKYSEAEQIFFSYTTDQLDSATASSPVKEKLTLFRGVGSFGQTVLNNAEYTERAYPSTSYDITVCLKGYATPAAGQYRNVLVMQRSEGSKALYINENEREFLLPRSTEWAVIKAVEVDNLTIEADFPLSDNKNSYESVRLIYIKQTA